MPAVIDKLLTAEEYQRLPEPMDGTRLELIRGEVVAMCRPNWEHGEIQISIGSLIKNFLRSNPIGRVASESGVITEHEPDTIRGPDVSFIRKERMPLGERMPKFAELTPDLCVEIISPSNTRAGMSEKIEEYFETGAKVVWVVDPEDRSATVYLEPDEGRKLNSKAVITGGEVLPGFSCKVAEFFE